MPLKRIPFSVTRSTVPVRSSMLTQPLWKWPPHPRRQRKPYPPGGEADRSRWAVQIDSLEPIAAGGTPALGVPCRLATLRTRVHFRELSHLGSGDFLDAAGLPAQAEGPDPKTLRLGSQPLKQSLPFVGKDGPLHQVQRFAVFRHVIQGHRD